MYLDNVIPGILGALFSPYCLALKIREPKMVSYGLMANLRAAERKGLFKGIRAIVDVGANIGQYAYMAHAVFPTIPIHSFEPVPASFLRLEENFRTYGIPGSVHAVALGQECGEAEFHLQPNSEQSSFLPKIGQEEDLPGTTIKVETSTLDRYALLRPWTGPYFLKIDTQGFEESVLRGGFAFLHQCSLVQLEVAIRPAYAGQTPAHRLLSLMDERGFDLIEVLDILRRPGAEGGAIAEADLLFRRRPGHREEAQ